MSKELWITRDKYGENEYLYTDENLILFWDNKPLIEQKQDEIVYYFDSDEQAILQINIYQFEELFGFIPAKGSCELFDLILKRKGSKINDRRINNSNNKKKSIKENC